MDSLAPIVQPLASRLIPLAAVIREDLRLSLRHWAFVAWGLLGIALAALWLTLTPAPPPSVVAAGFGGQPAEFRLGGQGTMTAGQLAGRLLVAQFLFFASFAIALGASALAGEADIAADAILCRGVSRLQYYLGKVVARVIAVELIFLLLMLPTLWLAGIRHANDMSWASAYASLKLVGGALAALTVIAVAGSAWFSSALPAVGVVWMVLYGIGIVAMILDFHALSPVVIADRLPAMLQGGVSAATGSLMPSVLLYAALGLTVLSLGYYSTRDV